MFQSTTLYGGSGSDTLGEFIELSSGGYALIGSTADDLTIIQFDEQLNYCGDLSVLTTSASSETDYISTVTYEDAPLLIALAPLTATSIPLASVQTTDLLLRHSLPTLCSVITLMEAASSSLVSTDACGCGSEGLCFSSVCLCSSGFSGAYCQFIQSNYSLLQSSLPLTMTKLN